MLMLHINRVTSTTFATSYITLGGGGLSYFWVKKVMMFNTYIFYKAYMSREGVEKKDAQANSL